MSIIKANTFQDRGGNVLLSSDGSGTISAGGAITNTPAFQAQISVTQAVPSGVYTKIQFNNEIFDTDSAYDNSTNYRFTAPSAGKYLFNANAKHAAASLTTFVLTFYKNGGSLGSSLAIGINAGTSSDWTQNISSIIDLSINDYVEVYAWHNRDTDSNFETGQFEAYRLIGA